MFTCLLSFDHLSHFLFSGERDRAYQKSFEFTESRRARSSEALTSASTLELISAGILFFFLWLCLMKTPALFSCRKFRAIPRVQFEFLNFICVSFEILN